MIMGRGLLTEAWTIHLRTRSFLRSQVTRLGKWVQCLRAFAALAQGMSLIPCTHNQKLTAHPATGNPSFGLLRYPHTCPHTYIHTRMHTDTLLSESIAYMLRVDTQKQQQTGNGEHFGTRLHQHLYPSDNTRSLYQAGPQQLQKKNCIYNGHLCFVTSLFLLVLFIHQQTTFFYLSHILWVNTHLYNYELLLNKPLLSVGASKSKFAGYKTGEMVRQWRALLIFTEDPGLTPSIYISSSQQPLTPGPDDPVPSSVLCGHQAHTWSKALIHMNKSFYVLCVSIYIYMFICMHMCAHMLMSFISKHLLLSVCLFTLWRQDFSTKSLPPKVSILKNTSFWLLYRHLHACVHTDTLI